VPVAHLDKVAGLALLLEERRCLNSPEGLAGCLQTSALAHDFSMVPEKLLEEDSVPPQYLPG
jgi:hypothetical protein